MPAGLSTDSSPSQLPYIFDSLGMLFPSQPAEHTLLASIQKATTQKFQPLGLIFAAKKDSSC